MQKRGWLQWIPLILFLCGVFLIVYFHLYQYFDLQILKKYQQTLHEYTAEHYWRAVFYYLVIATLAMAFAVPGVVFTIIAAGFLFGLIAGTIYAMVAMVTGSCLTYFAMDTAFRTLFKERAKPWLKRFQEGFQKDAASYLLSIRLVPGVPIWLINIVAGLFDIRFSVFLITAIIGMLPLNFIRVSVGTGLNYILAQNAQPNLRMLLTPEIGLPFLGLAVLILLRVFYKKWMEHRKNTIKL